MKIENVKLKRGKGEGEREKGEGENNVIHPGGQECKIKCNVRL